MEDYGYNGGTTLSLVLFPRLVYYLTSHLITTHSLVFSFNQCLVLFEKMPYTEMSEVIMDEAEVKETSTDNKVNARETRDISLSLG